MQFFENLKLDTWWGIVLYLGIALIAASFFIKVDFVQAKYLFGFGLGMFLIGLSFKIAEKYLHVREVGGILSTKIIKHNFFSILILIIGIVLILIFGFLLIKELI